MDRKIVYPGQIPLETDLLGTNQSTMVAVSKLAAAMFGTGGVVNGLAVGANTPAALNVVVSPGEIYQLANLEATAYSSLPTDVAHAIVKQGIQLDSVVLPCPPPATAGFSINYLIEATFLEVDTVATTLPYYNASNPSQAYSGPNNTGAQQATLRAGQVQLQAKAGVAASTGTQASPAVDAGYIALAVVTVANGQATIVAGNIAASTGSQILGAPLSAGRLLNIRVFNTPGSTTFVPSAGTSKVRVKVQGGGGAGSGAIATSASQIGLGGGGSAGSYCESFITSGFSGQLIVVGSGGAGLAGAAGGNGGASSFGSLMSAPGGLASNLSSAPFTGVGIFSGANSPPAATGGAVSNSYGGAGNFGIVTAVTSTGGVAVSGAGGGSIFGPGGAGKGASSTGAGSVGSSPGSGGGGALTMPSSAAQAGGSGSPGIVIIEEYA